MPEGIEFDEEQDNMLYSRIEPSSQTPKLVEWVLKTGVMKDQKQVTYVLLGIAVGATVIAVAIFLFGGSGDKASNTIDILPNESIGYPQNRL